MTYKPDEKLLIMIKQSITHFESLMKQISGSLFVFSTDYKIQYTNNNFINKFKNPDSSDIIEIFNSYDEIYPIEKIKEAITLNLLFSEELQDLSNNSTEQITIIPITLKDSSLYFMGMITEINTLTNSKEHLTKQLKELQLSHKNLKEKEEQLITQNKELDYSRSLLQSSLEQVFISEEKFRKLFNSMFHGIIIHEGIFNKNKELIDYKILDTNPAAERMLNLNKEETAGKSILTAYNIDTLPTFNEVKSVLKTGVSKYLEFYFEKFEKHFRVGISLIETNKFAVVFSDISKQKQLEEELKKEKINLEKTVQERTKDLKKSNKNLKKIQKELKKTFKKVEASEQKFHAISDSAIDPIIMINANGETLYWNNAAEKVFGYSSKEAIGKMLHPLIAPSKHNKDIKKGLKSFKQKGAGAIIGSRIKVSALTKNRTKITLEISISAIKLQGEWHAIGIARDITQQFNLETKLRNNLRDKFKLNKKLNQALLEADTANKAKSDFLAVISHEIRTPINGIVGIMNLLSDTKTTEEQEEYLKMLNLSTDTLLNIINNILDYSKLEVGKLTLQQHEFNLDENICNLLKCFSLIAQEKKINLAYSIAKNIPEILIGDSNKLSQIIINLVNNAIKFTPKGEISIKIKLVFQTNSTICLLFSVSDTGIGIPDDKKSIIFDSFTQVDNSTTRKYGGTGLGLAIASELIELMSGKIWIESKIQKGSTFNFTAIFNVTNKRIKDIDFNKLPVLVLCDNQTTRSFYQETLEKWNCNITTINNTDKITDAIDESIQYNTEFKTIIIDITQTDNEFIDFISYLSDSYQQALPKIIIMTTSNLFHVIKNTKPEIKNLIIKPVKQSELLEIIQRIII